MECDEQFNAGEFLPVTQISEAFSLRRSMGRLDSVDRGGLMDGVVLWTVWIVGGALWTVWSCGQCGSWWPYGRYGLMDSVDLVDGVVLWTVWSYGQCGSCGSCGRYGLMDSVDRVDLVDGVVLWTVWIVWVLWTVWVVWTVWSSGQCGRCGLMDGMWLWAAVCGGLYGMPDLL